MTTRRARATQNTGEAFLSESLPAIDRRVVAAFEPTKLFWNRKLNQLETHMVAIDLVRVWNDGEIECLFLTKDGFVSIEKLEEFDGYVNPNE